MATPAVSLRNLPLLQNHMSPEQDPHDVRESFVIMGRIRVLYYYKNHFLNS